MLVRIALLGHVALDAGPTVRRITAPQRAALLALLALADGSDVETDRILAALWGVHPVPTARNVVQVHVVALRKLLGADRLTTVSGGYALAGVSTDAVELERAVVSASRADVRAQPAKVLSTLGPWRPLLTAEPLPGLIGAAAFVPDEVERLRRLQRSALRLLGWASLPSDPVSAAATAESLLRDDAYDEDLHALRVEGLARAGRRGEALAAWREIRRRLRNDLGIDPSPRLREVQQRVLEPAGQRHVGVGPAPPAQADDRLVGRETELSELGALVAQNAIVTVTGLPGIGKSRLVEEYVRSTADDEVLDVVLRLDGQDTRTLLAAALGVTGSAGEGLAKALPWALAGRRARVVLDDAHLGRHVREVAELLSEQQDVSVLITSRSPLNCTGEATLVLRGLDAEPADGAPSPALKLLVAEAARFGSPPERVRPGDPALDAIAARVEGHPLGLLLAARRLGVLSPAQLLEGIDTATGVLRTRVSESKQGQRSLDAIVGEALEDLPAPQRTLLAAVQVFPTGMPADALVSAGLAGVGQDPLDVLADLVRRGLLRTVDDTTVTRYVLPEPIRGRVTRNRPAAAAAAAERAWLVEWACGLVGRSPYGPVGWPATYRQLSRLRDESENLGRAIECAVADGLAARASLLVAGTTTVSILIGRSADQLERIRRVLALPGLSPPDRVDMLLMEVMVESFCGRASHLAEQSRQAMAAARSLRDANRLVAAYNVEADRRFAAGEDLVDFCAEVSELLPTLEEPGARAVALSCLAAQAPEPARLAGAARRTAARAGMEILETMLLVTQAEMSLQYATAEGRRLVRPGEEPGRTALAAATRARQRSAAAGDAFFAAAATMAMAGGHLLQQDGEAARDLLLDALNAFAALGAPIELREAVLRLAVVAKLSDELDVCRHLLQTWQLLLETPGDAAHTEVWVREGMLAGVEPEGPCGRPHSHHSHPVVARVDEMLELADERGLSTP